MKFVLAMSVVVVIGSTGISWYSYTAVFVPEVTVILFSACEIVASVSLKAFHEASSTSGAVAPLMKGTSILPIGSPSAGIAVGSVIAP